MKRRDFIAVLGATAIARPLLVRAESHRAYVVGVFRAGATLPAERRAVFSEALRKLGWIEGKNIAFVDRFAENRIERLSEVAAELVRLKVDIIVVIGTQAAIAVRRATSTIPIVMAPGSDPVEVGLVASLARPGGNVTGLSIMAPEVGGKRLELLKEVFPGASRVAVLWNTDTPSSALVFKETKRAAKILGIEVQPLEVAGSGGLDGAFEAAVREHVDALIAVEDPLTFDRRERIVGFAADRRLPAVYGQREFVEAGGLMAYGVNFVDLMRRAASYVDKILRGTDTRDLPIEQPTKFDLVINLKTAKALGVTVPPSLLARADEVIE
jgi:putative tryptophan/tyrosine transport system substrate-binding protein